MLAFSLSPKQHKPQEYSHWRCKGDVPLPTVIPKPTCPPVFLSPSSLSTHRHPGANSASTFLLQGQISSLPPMWDAQPVTSIEVFPKDTPPSYSCLAGAGLACSAKEFWKGSCLMVWSCMAAGWLRLLESWSAIICHTLLQEIKHSMLFSKSPTMGFSLLHFRVHAVPLQGVLTYSLLTQGLVCWNHCSWGNLYLCRKVKYDERDTLVLNTVCHSISEVTYTKFFLCSNPFFSISHVYKCQ